MKDNFFLDLVYFDKSRVSPAVADRLAEFCSSPTFTPEAVRYVSEAAAQVCQWLRALNAFSRRQSNIRPTLQKLHDAQSEMKRVRGFAFVFCLDKAERSRRFPFPRQKMPRFVSVFFSVSTTAASRFKFSRRHLNVCQIISEVVSFDLPQNAARRIACRV
jgi:hypothetical protein